MSLNSKNIKRDELWTDWSGTLSLQKALTVSNVRLLASQTNKVEFIWKNTKVFISEFNKFVPQKRSTTKNRSS